MVPATIEASDASVNTMPSQPLGADRHAVPDDEADAGDAEQKPDHPAPGQRLAKEHRRKHSREDRIGADDQAADAGRYGLEPGIAEAEIERVVGDAEDREDAGIALTSARTTLRRAAQ